MTQTGKRKLKMQAIYVELPPDDLIEPSVLVKVIVNALYPEKTEGLTGIDCIIGKRVHVVTQPLTAKKTDLFGDANEPFWENRLHDMELSPQLALPLPKPKLTQYLVDGVVEDENCAKFWLPYHLTEDDLVKLRQLLKSLPPLAYPMTEGAISRFMDAYLAHPARPDWVPEFVSHATIRIRLEARTARSEEHWEAIRLAIECGQISACNSNRVPTRILSSGALISRSSAVEYLKRCGISVVGESQPTNRTDNDEPDHQEAIFTASGNRVWTKVGGQEAWTPEELEAIETRLRSKNPRTEKKYTNTEVAKLIGLTSASRITQLMTELRKIRRVPADSIGSQLNRIGGIR